MNLDLKNKVFLIAGSSKGIGLGIAKCFLTEGARVVITGRNQMRLQQAYDSLSEHYDPQKILALNKDLQVWGNIKSLFETIQNHFGRVDGIVANIGSGSEPIDIPDNQDIWNTSYDKNVKASMLLTQAAIPLLKQQGGNIIFISSIAGIEDIKAPLAYSMHKSAINTAAKKLSRYLAKYHIRVNVVAPGNIFFADGNWEKKINKNQLEVDNYIDTEVPLKSFGTPEDIGNICVFLSSEKAKFITGSLIVADGGQTRNF